MTKFISIVLPLVLLAPATLVSAIPNVTTTQIGQGSCAGFPNYYPEPGSDFTQPFYLHPDQADNSTINGLYTNIDGNDIVIATDPMLAKVMYMCYNATLQEFSTERTVFFSADRDNEVLAYFRRGLRPETYVHSIDGVQQGGVFLGNAGVTTWAFKFLPGPGGAGSEDFFGMRLLGGLNDTLAEGEFKGFIKLTAA